jgi:serine/threonine protein kinase
MDLKKEVKYLDQVLGEVGIDLLLKLLTYDPNQRISAIQALKHEYFKDMKPPKEH